MPEENIAACVACHGPNAEGIGTIPRIGGLDYTYLKRRLEQWAEGYHGSLGHPMPHIATQLSQDQIEELASYLSFVK
jgi:cytochrome c553